MDLSLALSIVCLIAQLHFEGRNGQTVPQAISLVTTAYCGVSKGCFRSPLNCNPPNCDALATWNITVPGYVDFELMATTPGWAALGLSYDSSMGSDSVMYCSLGSNTSLYNVDLSFNNPNPRFNRPLSYSSSAMSSKSATYVNGQIHCRFRRAVAADDAEVYRLDAQYYLLLGFGPVNSTGSIAFHSTTPKVSPMQVNIATERIDVGSTSAATVSPINMNTNNSFAGPLQTQVSYQITADNQNVQFKITGTFSTGESGYVSLGFSNGQTMNDNSVIDCIRTMDGTLIVQSSYNGDRVNIVKSPPQIGLQPVANTYANGQIACIVIRPIAGVNDPEIFPLNKQYYLFLATGTVDSTGAKVYHGANKAISSSPIDVRQNTGSQSSYSSGHCDVCLKRAHACLMITAWVLMVSTSIIIARYFKTAWPGKKILNLDVWFVIHFTLMLLALCCTITAFVIIFVVNMGKMSKFSEGSPKYYWIHARLGIAVMILVIINPVMAIFRCKPDGRFRPIFNWLHWLVGTTVHIIAMITIFFGAKIGEANPNDIISHIAVFWILIAFVGFHVIVEILLSINKCISEAVSKRHFQVQYEMSKPGEVPRVMEPLAGNRCTDIFRYCVLAVYFTFVLTLWLAMIILIGSGNVGYGHTYL